MVRRREATVGCGVATAFVVDALGWSGAAVFCTCVDANAPMPVAVNSVSPVAMPRSAVLDVMTGLRVFMAIEGGQQDGAAAG